MAYQPSSSRLYLRKARDLTAIFDSIDSPKMKEAFFNRACYDWEKRYLSIHPKLKKAIKLNQIDSFMRKNKRWLKMRRSKILLLKKLIHSDANILGSFKTTPYMLKRGYSAILSFREHNKMLTVIHEYCHTFMPHDHGHKFMITYFHLLQEFFKLNIEFIISTAIKVFNEVYIEFTGGLK
jgi:hypothetical protein